MKEMNLAELELITGITFKTLRNRLRTLKPTLVTINKGVYYDTRAALNLLFSSQKQGEETGLTQQKTRLACAQADKIELEIKKMNEELIDAEVWCDHWSKALVSFKQAMNNIALKYSGQLLNTKNVDEVYKILTAYSHDVLDGISIEANERAGKINSSQTNDNDF